MSIIGFDSTLAPTLQKDKAVQQRNATHKASAKHVHFIKGNVPLHNPALPYNPTLGFDAAFR